MTNRVFDWRSFDEAILDLAGKIKASEEKYNWIIGIARGGLFPSVVLSNYLSVKHGVLTIQSYGADHKKQKLNKDLYVSMVGNFKYNDKVLLVDDIGDGGETLQEAIKSLKKIDSDIKHIDTATLFYKEKSVIKPTYYYEKINDNVWVDFPWEVKQVESYLQR